MTLHPHLQTLGWALLHFLWQGCLLGLAAALAFRLSARRGPQFRYLLGLAFLSLALLSPLLTAWILHQGSVPPGLPGPGEARFAEVGTPATLVSLPPTLRLRAALAPALPWILWGWALGASLLALRLAGGWLWLQRLKARMEPLEAAWDHRLRDLAQRMGLRRAFRAGISRGITSPLVIGWIRPVLLIPASLLTGMDPLGVEALLAHEVAHLRRHDVFFNWLQCAVEVLLFYHPAVWWLSRRTRLERECCCDDVAVATCGDPLRYAESLDRLDDLQTLHLIPAQAAHGANLMYRITRLLTPTSTSPRIPLALPLMALLAAGALSLSARSGQAAQPQATPKASLAPKPARTKAAPSGETKAAPGTPAPKAQEAPLRRSITFKLVFSKTDPARLEFRATSATRAEIETALARIESLIEAPKDGGEVRPSVEGRWELKTYTGPKEDLLSFVFEKVTPTEARKLF